MLVDDYQLAGSKVATWNGRNSEGVKLSSGTYFLKMQAGSYTEIKKMVLLK